MNVSDCSLSLLEVLRDSGRRRRMKATSATATRLAVRMTRVSLPVASSMPAPSAGERISEAANPAVTSP